MFAENISTQLQSRIKDEMEGNLLKERCLYNLAPVWQARRTEI